MKKKDRAAIYLRVSTSDGRQNTDNQLEEAEQLIARRDLRLVKEYVDHETGTTSDRPQFQKLFEDAARRKFDVVVFWALDRFSREGTLATLQHLNKLSELGIQFYSVQEPYLDTTQPFGDVIVSILATLAQQESVRLGERTRAGIERVRAGGKPWGRPRTVHTATTLTQMRAGGMKVAEVCETLQISTTTYHKILQREDKP